MNDTVLLTVFTPTFNRAHTLPRTYASLKEQDEKCFEWLVVDDGSTDDTKNIVESWMKENNGFKIRYVYKENGGMHTAYNVAYENIQTELNVCIDSDDCLAPGAARKIKELWERVKGNGYAGLIGLDADMKTGEIIGKGFPESLKETTFLEYYRSGGLGDKKFVYRTDVIKQYPPYPEFEGEHYVGISCKYAMIDQDYKLVVLNDVLCDVEYQADGHSHSMYLEYIKNPKGFAYYRKIFMKYPISTKNLISSCIHYVSSSLIAKNKEYISESPRKLLTLLLTPCGFALSVFIRLKQFI